MQLEARKYLFDIERAGALLTSFAEGKSLERLSCQSTVAFRNVLIHGYAEIDEELVWDLLSARLPGLLQDIAAIKASDTGSSG